MDLLPVPKQLRLFLGLYSGLLFSLPLGQEKLTYLLLLALFVLSIISLKAVHWRLAFEQKSIWLSAAFFLWYTVSLLWSENLSAGGRQLETKMSFLLAPPALVAFALFTKVQHRDQLLQWFIWGNLAALSYALAKATWLHLHFDFSEAAVRPNFFVYEQLSSDLMHPGYLGSFMGLAVLANWKLISQKPALRHYISLALLLLALFLLQARMSLLALLLVSMSYLLFRSLLQGRYQRLFIPVAIVALGFLVMRLAPQTVVKRYMAVPQFDYDISGEKFNSATYRLAEWHCASIGIKESFWWGYGIGDSRQSLQEIYRREGFWAGLARSYNAHNQYLESWLSAGIPAVLLLLGLLGWYFYRGYNSAPWLAMAVAFFALCLLTESMLERAWGVLLINLIFPFFSSPFLGKAQLGHEKERIEEAEEQ